MATVSEWQYMNWVFPAYFGPSSTPAFENCGRFCRYPGTVSVSLPTPEAFFFLNEGRLQLRLVDRRDAVLLSARV